MTTILPELPYPPALTPQMVENMAEFIRADPDLSAAFGRMLRGVDDLIAAMFVPDGVRRYRCGAGWVAWRDGRWRPVVRSGAMWAWA